MSHEFSLSAPGGAMSRRAFFGVMAGALGACQTTAPVEPPPPPVETMLLQYQALPNERFPIPAVEPRMLAPEFRRQQVDYATAEQPGTVVVDPYGHYLYLVQDGGKAMRYGVGVGRAGFGWSGRAVIAYKREWPRWTPPAEMIVRQPELEPYRNGMEPSLENPLGARALYIFQNGVDTIYRVHGSNEPWSIGQSVSSGCIRLVNQDIIDLYNRVPSGSKIVVLDQSGAIA